MEPIRNESESDSVNAPPSPHRPPPQLRKRPALGNQLPRLPLFHNPAIPHHHHPIRMPQRAQAVGQHKTRPPLHQQPHRLLRSCLGQRINRSGASSRDRTRGSAIMALVVGAGFHDADFLVDAADEEVILLGHDSEVDQPWVLCPRGRSPEMLWTHSAL